MKKVLILSSSPRRNGNSDALCDQFARGAAEAGHEVVKIRLYDKVLNPCRACYACAESGKCVQRDDGNDVVEAMNNADVIVLATPVYFYTMCGQLKNAIDRSVMRYPMHRKELFYIMTMADDNPDNFRGTIEALRGFTACCEESREIGMVCAAGVYETNTVQATSAWQEAYEKGKKL